MIDWSASELDRFLADDPGGPVVMLNLLRFRPDGGRERYAEYAANTRETTSKLGVEVVYYGTGGPALVADPGQEWDAVLLVRYPSRQAFGEMVNTPAYQAGTHLRSEALLEAVLQPTTPMGG